MSGLIVIEMQIGVEVKMETRGLEGFINIAKKGILNFTECFLQVGI